MTKRRPSKVRGKAGHNDGKTYEKAAESYFRTRYGASLSIRRDVKLPNNRGRKEQIDILIEGALHPDLPIRVAIEAKDYGRKLTKKDVRDIVGKFTDAEVEKGIIVCTLGLQADAELIRAAARGPKIELIIKSLGELTEGAWAVDFLDAVPLIKAAKQDASPDVATIQRVVLVIETHAHYLRYFFHDLHNARWASILVNEGVFERLLAGEIDVGVTDAILYICRCVREAPEALVEVAGYAKRRLWWLAEKLMAAALLLDPTRRSEFVLAAIEWEFDDFQDVETAHKLILAEAESGSFDQALRLFDRMTDLQWLPQDTGQFYVDKLKAPVDEYAFCELTTKVLPQMATVDAAATLRYTRERLWAVAGPRNAWDDPAGSLDIVCHVGRIGPLGVVGLIENLAYAYRDCLVTAAGANHDAWAREIAEVLEEPTRGILVRCCLYSMSAVTQSDRDLTRTIIGDRRLWALWWAKPELETLVIETWPSLQELDRVQVVKQILDLPMPVYDGDQPPENASSIWQADVVRWLGLLEPLGWPDEVANAAQAVLDDSRRSDGVVRPTSQKEFFGFYDQSPTEASTLERLSSEDALRLCDEFQPYLDGFVQKSRRALSIHLAEQVAARPIEFLVVASSEAVRYCCYRSAIMQGLRRASDQIPPSDDRAIAILIEEFVCQVAQTEGTQDPFDDGNLGQVATDGARLLRARIEASFRRRTSDLPALMNCWDCLWRHEQMFPTGCAVYGETLESRVMAENSCDGQLGQAICYLALAGCWYQKDDSSTVDERSSGREVYKTSLSRIDEFIVNSKEPRVRGNAGTILTDLWLLDAELARRHLLVAFETADPDLWGAVWTSYIGQRPRNPTLVKLLSPQYERAIDLLNVASGLCWGQLVGAEIGHLWFAGEIDQNDRLFLKLVREAPPACLVGVGRQAEGLLKGSWRTYWPQALQYWKFIVELRRNDSGVGLAYLARWLSHAPVDLRLEGVVELLIASLVAETLFIRHDVLRFLEERASAEPAYVARVLRIFADLDLRILLQASTDSIINGLRACSMSNDEAAVRMAIDAERTMLLRGLMWVEGATIR